MITVDKLNDFGANTAEGLARCCGNEAFYLKLVNIACDEPDFEALKSAIAQNDLNKAFEAAHALKGVLGNLSLTPLYDKTCEITELLRERREINYSELLSELLGLKEELKAL